MENGHRLPFLIDAIFKEDIDIPNKEKILNFVHKKRPTDIQLIVSIIMRANMVLIDNKIKIIKGVWFFPFNTLLNLSWL